MSLTDERLQEIRDDLKLPDDLWKYAPSRVVTELLNEVERLRKIEDAARDALEELDDAIKAAVNATKNDAAGWTQEDYDRWNGVRERLAAALSEEARVERRGTRCG